MSGRAPDFWQGPPGPLARLLQPASLLYGAVAAHRLRHAPRVGVGLPVLCVGNPTVGGSGKTPVALALGQAANRMGLKPGFLSRGHGGRVGAARLLGAGDTAREVGDEPLLLAAGGPVAVGADRARGAALLEQAGCDCIIMDDGFQSARIAIDCALLVVDRRAGLGNGLCLPAGPLRAPLTPQLSHAHAVLAMGEGNGADGFLEEAGSRGLPVFSARLAPKNPQAVRGKRLLAFAGIGRPEKFFSSLEEAGGVVEERRVFGDHHAYRKDEIAALMREAETRGLVLVTTAKDMVRVRDAFPDAQALVLEVEARFGEPDAGERLVGMAVERKA